MTSRSRSGWSPFTAALWYFRHIEVSATPPNSDKVTSDEIEAKAQAALEKYETDLGYILNDTYADGVKDGYKLALEQLNKQ